MLVNEIVTKTDGVPLFVEENSCAHCGGAMADTEALPFLRGGGGHVWMHGRCHAGWMVQRRRQAGKALRQLGISLTGPA